MEGTTMNSLEHTSIGIRALDHSNDALLRDIAELERKLKTGRMNIDHTFRKEILELQRKSHAYFLGEIGRAASSLETRRERADELTAFLKNWFASYVRNMNGPLKTEAFQKGLAENGHLTYAPVPLHRMELIGTRVWLPAARQ